MINHLQYRVEHDIPPVPSYVDDTSTPPSRDKLGRPIQITCISKINADEVFESRKSFVAWRIRELEKTIALFDFVNVNSVVFIQDFSGFRMFGGVPAKVKEGISEFIKIKKDSYPELTAESIFVNVPKIFSLLFQTFKFVIPQRTLKKMTIIQSKRDVMLTLLEKIHPADLDDSFGGLFRLGVGWLLLCPIRRL